MPAVKPLAAALLVALGLAGALSVAPRAATAPAAFKLHEWGTFTSVSGSDGVLLPGLEAEEESLPWFVKSHDGMGDNYVGKGWLRQLSNVTIKMETPVMYFYADEPFKAHVEVGFHGGSISQWYPERTDGERPPPYEERDTSDGGTEIVGGDIDFAKGYEGAITWDVDVLPPGDQPASLFFKGGDETLTWVYPRQTDANLLRTADGAYEKYLFYRGVGHFDLPVRTTMTDDVNLHIANVGPYRIPDLLVYYQTDFQTDEGQVRTLAFDDLAAGDAKDVNLTKLPNAPVYEGEWRTPVYEELVDVLMDAGLFRKEADAMVQTWWHSYFERPGLRVFWIVPTEFTDTILPLAVDPAPAERVRVLVGRSEVLTPAFERRLVDELDTDWDENDRFYQAYQARLQALEGTR